MQRPVPQRATPHAGSSELIYQGWRVGIWMPLASRAPLIQQAAVRTKTIHSSFINAPLSIVAWDPKIRLYTVTKGNRTKRKWRDVGWSN